MLCKPLPSPNPISYKYLETKFGQNKDCPGTLEDPFLCVHSMCHVALLQAKKALYFIAAFITKNPTYQGSEP